MAIHTMDMKTVSPDSLTVPVSNTNTAGLSPSIDGNTDSVPQVLVGYQKDGFGTGIDQGIKVSKQGYDVKTAADSQLIMSSAFNSFKIVATGVVLISKDPNSALAHASIQHGLSTAPMHICFINNNSDYSLMLPYLDINPSTGVIWTLVQATCNSTDITFELISPVAGAWYVDPQAFYIRYYILVETAATS